MKFLRPTSDIVYPKSDIISSLTKHESISVSKSDIYTGGPQFIAKLYTEALSRCPTGAEFADATAHIKEQGCTKKMLAVLACEIFSSDAYQKAALTRDEICFTLYRAILSRDPMGEELASFNGDAVTAVKALIAGAEFDALMEGIIKGPYFWHGTNYECYTGSQVMLASEVQKLLRPDTVTALPQGTLVIVDETINMPIGAKLITEGEPTHYAKMARFLRQRDTEKYYDLLRLSDSCDIRSIFVDGALSEYHDKLIPPTPVMVLGNSTSVTDCRVSDSISSVNIFIGAQHDVYIARNLITAYASDHDRTWQDGIHNKAYDALIEYNEVVDSTDAPIVTFRYLLNTPDYDHKRAQNSIIRFNKIFNAGNSAYCAHDFETVHYLKVGQSAKDDANMTGLVSYHNEIWSSWRAHFHMIATFSTVPWQGSDNNDMAHGGSFYNNCTPEGCFALCACGINADKVQNAAIRGNRFTLYLGDWCRSDPRLGKRAYSVHADNCSGDFQPGYSDMAMYTEKETFIINLIGGLQLEAEDSVLLERWELCEGRVTIPIERFMSR
ncbi:MAG: hypothetical protein IJA85_04525 [Clostridia bacterium]|nr:hypothetical protein [Clostridia bacterium]